MTWTCSYALFAATHSYSIGIVMAVITSVVGGMIRDVLSGEVPLILRSEIYASASLCGAALFALLFYLGLASPFAASLSIAVTLGIRIPAMRHNLSLPPLRLAQGKRGDGGEDN